MTQTDKLKEKALTKKPVSITDMIQESAEKLGQALPSHMRPERMIRIAMTTLRMNPRLYKCDPHSFLGALFQSAQLGLEPNIEGQAYIIPYKNSRLGVDQAQFQIGYKGYVELFWRHQSAVSLQMEKIHKNDIFEFDLGKNELTHKPKVFGEDRGEVIGYYAIAHLKGGGRAMKVMSVKEAYEHGKRYSKTFDRKTGKFYPDSPWGKNFDDMAMKTVLIKLMKLLPKSIEIQKAMAMDESTKTSISSDMFEVPNEDPVYETEEVKEEEKKDGDGPKELL